MRREVLRFYREFAATAPDELTTIFELELAPPLPFLPEDVHGKPIVMVGACYAGPPEDGAEVVRPLKEFGNPIADLLEPKPYLALQSMFDPLVPHGWHRYWKSVELPPLTDDAIDTLIDHTSRITSPRSYTIVFQLGGALARVAEDATAFGQRDAAHNVVINAVWTEDDPDARPAHRLGARLLRRHAAPRPRPRLRQLPRRRGARPRPAGLRRPRSTTGWSSSNASTTPRTSSASTRTSSLERPSAPRRADDGTRTHDLLHGKQTL